ncbi:kinesin-like protein KIF26A isoform X2 [Pseudopipra pipra]|uniref:kinesin-like protein KIF26A isoform X2 n=1 Tax=Pseudopipra pipra TaxID=415032 RepID=UPI00313A49DD
MIAVAGRKGLGPEPRAPGVAEGSAARELSPRKRPGAEEERCASRPPPEGAGAAAGAEQRPLERAAAGGWCRSCQAQLAELRRQAARLAAGGCPPNAPPDPRLSALIFDKLQVPDYLQKNRNEGESRCETCATHLNQLKQEAIQMMHTLSQTSYPEMPDLPPGAGAVTSMVPRMVTVSSQRDLPLIAGQVGRQPGKSPNLFSAAERKKGLGWSQGVGGFPNSSVQVTVAPSGLSGALSSVTIQAQQYLEGMWSISRVNSFLPQACLAETAPESGRDVPSVQISSGQHNSDPSGAGGMAASQSMVAPAGVSAGTSAAASFFISLSRGVLLLPPPHPSLPSLPAFLVPGLLNTSACSDSVIWGSSAWQQWQLHWWFCCSGNGAFHRAAQKLNLSSKRKKYHPPLPHTHDFSIYATNFSGILQLCPPPAPPCLLRAVSKIKDNPGIGKVKVMVRICSSQGAHETSESMSFLKVDPRKKQITFYDPAASGPSNAGHRRGVVAVPKMFAFDAVFPQDASQAEVCSGTVAEVIQSVVNGADGCIFCFGHVKLGKSFTMIGKDNSTQSLGIIPCAISWLFKLINERKEKTGTRFSIRVSAVEISGKDENLKDLLAEVATGSLQDGQSPGVYLREDPICGTQLQNQSELRAPTAEKAAFFLDAAIAARSTSKPECEEEDRRNSHMLFTLHIYQYRMEKSGKGGMSGGRSRLHLIDLGSCEKVLSKSRDGGGSLCLSLSALGNVILALINGAKHVPYKDNKLTMLLRESLGNINCRTTMIAHISDSPANYAETLTTIQLASRIHRMRKKKSKYASSSSGGESSCEEGHVRRPPHLRPFHPRTVALDPDLPVLNISSDPDYSSSSEQSCDTVIYVGPNGAALSDRELTDNEGPPEFVPIIPSLNKKRNKDNSAIGRSSDKDHFKCNTFAELQERLECIDGSEEPMKFACGEISVGSSCSPVPGGTENTQSKLIKEKISSPSGGFKKPIPQEAASPKKGHNLPFQAVVPRGGNGSCQENSTPHLKAEVSKLQSRADNKIIDSILEGERETITESLQSSRCSPSRNPEQNKAPAECVIKEKSSYMKRPLPSPAPPPPQQREHSLGSKAENLELDNSNAVRTPPVGMSKQMGNNPEQNPVGSTFLVGSNTQNQSGAIEVHSFRSAFRGKCFDRDILTTTVTLQQPVELNGEDELVFTVVEELSISGIMDNGRPSSIISFNSDCSLQALASGSRPVSIISSINDEFDAYTSQESSTGVNIDIVVPFAKDPFTSSRRSSISSWLSEVSICTVESDGAQSSDSFVAQSSYSCNKSEEPFNLDSSHLCVPLKSALNDSGFCFSELESESLSSSKLSSGISKSPQTSETTKASQIKSAFCVTDQPVKIKFSNSRDTPVIETIHSSLPRKTKTTSSPIQNNTVLSYKELQNPHGIFEDPWLLRTDYQLEAKPVDSLLSPKSHTFGTEKQPEKAAQYFGTASRPAKSQTMLACSQRVVDGCEMACKSSSGTAKKSEVVMKMPQLKRGATTLGVMPVSHANSTLPESVTRGNSDAPLATGSLKSSLGKKNAPQKSTMLPRPGGPTPPTPPVRKSSLEQKPVGLGNGGGKASGLDFARAPTPKAEDEADLRFKAGSYFSESASSKMNLKGDHSLPKMTSSLKAKTSKSEAVHRYGSHMSLERCDSLTSVGSKASVVRESGSTSNSRAGRSVPRLGVPPAASSVGLPLPFAAPAPGKNSQAKPTANQKVPANGNKNRGLSASGSKSLSSSVKSLAQPAGKSSGMAPGGKAAPRSVQPVSGKPGRGTIMGTKQAMRAANSRVNELVSGGSAKAGHFRGSTDSDSGNDSGINLSDEKSQIPVLPSPYSKITAPRRPQRYSSGHGSDNSSVLSGELPPAMGRTALFYHSGGSSGYESMIRDSEATGSASSAHDSMSESGMSSPGRMRSLKSPKKRSTGLQRRRLIPAPLPDAASLGRKPSVTGQWVDLPPLPGTLKEPFEIKVYEIDDVERLQRHRQEETEPFQDVEKGLMYFHTKLKILERRQQRIREIKAKHEFLKEELEETKCRLMMDPNKWKEDFEVDPDLDKESQEYLEALEQVTEELEQCVNLCKSHIMIVTCFDIGITDAQDGVREVEV